MENNQELRNTSWMQMQEILDRELPQDKKKNRGVVFYLLLLGSIALFMWLLIYSQEAPINTLDHKSVKDQNQPNIPTASTNSNTDGNCLSTLNTQNSKLNILTSTNTHRLDQKATLNTAKDIANYKISNGKISNDGPSTEKMANHFMSNDIISTDGKNLEMHPFLVNHNLLEQENIVYNAENIGNTDETDAQQSNVNTIVNNYNQLIDICPLLPMLVFESFPYSIAAVEAVPNITLTSQPNKMQLGVKALISPSTSFDLKENFIGIYAEKSLYRRVVLTTHIGYRRFYNATSYISIDNSMKNQELSNISLGADQESIFLQEAFGSASNLDQISSFNSTLLERVTKNVNYAELMLGLKIKCSQKWYASTGFTIAKFINAHYELDNETKEFYANNAAKELTLEGIKSEGQLFESVVTSIQLGAEYRLNGRFDIFSNLTTALDLGGTTSSDIYGITNSSNPTRWELGLKYKIVR